MWGLSVCGTQESSVISLGYISHIKCRDGDTKKRKRKGDTNEVEALFSKKRSSKWLTEDSTPLLPIKDKRKVIQRSQVIDHNDSGILIILITLSCQDQF